MSLQLTVMEERSAISSLRSLWSGKQLEKSGCCRCGQPINAEDVLARTFVLEDWGSTSTSTQHCVEKLKVPAMAKVILVYHRHLACLIASTLYVAVTHVWDTEVAELQSGKTESTASAVKVAKIVFEMPTRICLGLAASLPEKFEIWHDYISVPQWQPTLKAQIIQSIPRIFNHATFVIAHLSDLDIRSVEMMRNGISVYERCRGISNVCNTKWFSRMWTAMELTQSRELRIMLKDFTIVENRDPSHPFIYELGPAWRDMAEKQGSPHEVESMIGMGYNLVPWQLCFFEHIRDQSLHGNRVAFAEAHEFLARRCTTIPRDFFHALLGILQINLTHAQLSHDFQQAMLQIAKQCMQRGDYSPLFMIPASVQREPNETMMRSTGYLDLVTYAMGPERGRGTFEIRFRSDNPIFKAEVVGVVHQIRQIDWIKENTRSLLRTFTILCKLTLEFTGLDIDAFVATIVRLYGQSHEKVLNLLSKGDQLHQLQDNLSTLHNTSLEDSEDNAARIADVLGLPNLSLVKDFASPMQFLSAHGGSLHLGNAGAIVIVNCYRCNGNFPIRVALLKPASSLLGVKAYRIPGLKYLYTQVGGVGFLHQDGHIVGRFLWGIPTCECPKIEEVEVHLDDFPLPRPNTCIYGFQAEAGRLPIHLEDIIKS